MHAPSPLNFSSTTRFQQAVTARLSAGLGTSVVQVCFPLGVVAIQDFSAFHALNQSGKRLKEAKEGGALVLVELDEFSRKFIARADSHRRHFDVAEGEEEDDKPDSDEVVEEEGENEIRLEPA